ncbi:hypothetical protein [Dactylosporangium sp. NPDC051541]|uniref:hypothetical protein n=1 Tax=Dactylosporangium sp. NPDC051541 TaxID=3363977 RepID=UPI00379A40D4
MRKAFAYGGAAAFVPYALPLYMRERFPEAFAPARRPRIARAAAAAAVLFGVVSAYWALGGHLGIGHPEFRDPLGRLQLANDALWAFAAAAGVLLLGRGTVPMVLTWIGSGFLFAWNAWKLPLGILLADRAEWPERPFAAAARFGLGIAAGVHMALAIRALRRPGVVPFPEASASDPGTARPYPRVGLRRRPVRGRLGDGQPL